jgi:hypothetical protein
MYEQRSSKHVTATALIVVVADQRTSAPRTRRSPSLLAWT